MHLGLVSHAEEEAFPCLDVLRALKEAFVVKIIALQPSSGDLLGQVSSITSSTAQEVSRLQDIHHPKHYRNSTIGLGEVVNNDPRSCCHFLTCWKSSKGR